MPAKKTAAKKAAGRSRVIAKVNCHWQGELVEAGNPIPASWPRDYVDGLLATGGARKG